MTIISAAVPLTRELTGQDFDLNLQNIGMDSVSFVSVVVQLEDYFSVQFSDEQLVITKMNSVHCICRAIEEAKRSEK